MLRNRILLVFLALVALRLLIGYHFFMEGTSKLKSGDFTAEPFLRNARGPLAEHYHRLLDDPDGRWRLCVVESEDTSSRFKYRVDPEITFALWDDFLDRASPHYGFGSEQLQQEIAQRREQYAEQIERARSTKDSAIDTGHLERLRQKDADNIRRLREQKKRAEEILAAHKQEMSAWLADNRSEVTALFNSAHRLSGFERDGQSRSRVATEVESLRGQLETIRADRQRKVDEWTGQVEAIWDSLELQINSLAVDSQTAAPPVSLHRPFDQKFSKLKVINNVIPWFDTIIGGLLLIGLFTKLASIAGAAFLGSIILSQPPWIPGTAPSYLYGVELVALLVIVVTGAGRLGGLDHFFSRQSDRGSNDHSSNAFPQHAEEPSQ